MPGPINKVFKNGIQVCEWEGGKYSIEKSYKDKTTGEYKKTTTYFGGDLLTLRDLIDQLQIKVAPRGERSPTAASRPSRPTSAHGRVSDRLPPAIGSGDGPPPMDDDDIAF